MKNNNIYQIWDELEDMTVTENANALFKNVLSTKIVDMFIQTTLDNEMFIFLHMNQDELEYNSHLKGLDVKAINNEKIDNQKKCIKFENLNKENVNIFKAFSATLFDNLQDQNMNNVKDAIDYTIDEFKYFFSGENKTLGDKEQQGIFGELLYIQSNIDNESIIESWEGSNKNKHDFVFKEKSVEIKTTKNQMRMDIHISNECQLDNSHVDELDLVVYRLDKTNVGKTIYDLYNEIIQKINKKQKNLFEQKLYQVGVTLKQLDTYNTYKPIEVYKYVVDDDFPKIRKDNLSDKIFEVKYYLNLDGIPCEKEVL